MPRSRNRSRYSRPRPLAIALQPLEPRTLLTVTINPLPSIYGPTITLPPGKAIQVPLTATNTLTGPLTYTVTSSVPSIVPVLNALKPAVSANRSYIRIATSLGNMDFQLFNDIAPQTVSYILSHLNSPDFTNSIFHRIIKQSLPAQTLSIVQGGDRDGDGQDNNTGLALEQELDTRVLYTGHGQLAEARTTQPDSGGSQFFVTLETQRFLDFNYTIYGQLVRGFDVLTALNNVTTNLTTDRPITPPTLLSITAIQDTTDAVVNLISTSATPTAGTITVTARDAVGNQDVKIFNVATVADNIDDPPFLPAPSVVNRAIPKNTTTLINFGTATDLESSAYFIPTPQALTTGFGGNLPDSSHINIIPDNNFTGLVQVQIFAAQSSNSNIRSGRTYSFFVDSGTAPVAALHASDVFAKAGGTATFTVTYTDDTLLDIAAISSNNAVSVIGPRGINIPAAFVSIDNASSGPTHTVTYRMTAPGGNWDTPDAGAYYVIINPGVVKDTLGNTTAAQSLGAFYYSPTAFFDERYYLTMNPDIAAAIGSGALASGYQHFIAQGQSEGRPATPFFSEHFYLTLYADVRNAVINHQIKSGWEHFVNAGQFEGRYANPAYDEKTYLRLNPDVANAINSGEFSSGLEHFILSGQFENRTSSLFYDVHTYITANPDVVAAVAAGTAGIAHSVTMHFLIAGQHEGRTANTLFSESYYLAHNPDIVPSITNHTFASGFEHFELSGTAEKRNPSAGFNSQFYLSTYPDIAAAITAGQFKSAFEHYMLSGRSEGRLAHA